MPVEHRGSDVHVSPPGRFGGIPDLPGSKSLTNRGLACAALADGTSELVHPSFADDAWCMIGGLRRLGVNVDVDEARARVKVIGCRGHVPAGEADIDVGNAGTAMRFLTALACLGRGRYRLDGTPRMRERPIGHLVDALRSVGAGIGYEQADGFPPLTILAQGLQGGHVHFRTPPSSQFVSALLMVAPYAARDVFIEIDGPLPSRPYLDMTIAVMRSLRVEVVDDDSRLIVPAAQRYVADTLAIEPDASAATYFWAAAAITGTAVTVRNLSRASLQGDVRFVDVLERMGCSVQDTRDGVQVTGPPPGALRGITVDMNALPDAVQTLAVAALFADGPTRIDNVANLRVKETDRLAALHTELTRFGAAVEPRDDGLTIQPPRDPVAAAVNTYDDHRMAMSFALAGLRIPGVVIRDAGCVSKSFPAYFSALANLE